MVPPTRAERLRSVAPALAVLLVFSLVLAASGVWPPFVAVESGSMEPHLERGDLVYVTATERFAPPSGAPVATHAAAAEYRRLGARGDVLVFDSPSHEGLVIHRAHLRVDRGENWYDEADSEYLPASVDSCRELAHCPAPHDGYVTKGDANDYYDQAGGMAVVREAWITGKGQAAVPWIGHLRLLLAGR
ncbi:S26 family signal peptidase [Salinigranum rubrum]|uniref:S26 family signal peptidase n=1 Tax=Salinigranum rubrum TaxID=755307 RepID=A0A2I8VM12_9EURY|nr:S26 family signal peptidase [Salinigranum rubrum]AUV82970.1 S26 family signal peptidase [Salinigranum rubrum]